MYILVFMFTMIFYCISGYGRFVGALMVIFLAVKTDFISSGHVQYVF